MAVIIKARKPQRHVPGVDPILTRNSPQHIGVHITAALPIAKVSLRVSLLTTQHLA